MSVSTTLCLVVCVAVVGMVLAQQPSPKASEKRYRRSGEAPPEGFGGEFGDRDPRDFRSRIVQQVWEKANRMSLPVTKMDSLRGILQQHDIKMLQLKKHQRDGGDRDGETEALLRRRLTQIMQDFGLIPPEDESKRRKLRGGMSNETPEKVFKDAKTNKLWEKAKQMPNFNEMELEQLREELGHYQQKQEQFEQLSQEIYGDNKDSANRVDKTDATAMDSYDRSLKELDLKLQHRELNKDFQSLSAKMIPEEHRGEFMEPRIINLWREATFGNFTEDELESIRVELKHFETKLNNFESMHVESLHAEKEYRVAKKSGEPADALRHRTLREAAQQVGKSISSTMKIIRERIQKGRDKMGEL